MKINREDMLELTRRMTPTRHCFTRVAGCYVDADGEFDGSFNIHFRRLSAAEQTKNLALARTVPFAAGQPGRPSSEAERLRSHVFTRGSRPQPSVWTLLMALREVGLKNDAMLDTFYDLVMEHYRASGPYAIFLYHGSYDVPRKGSDKAYQYESEEVYSFLIGTVGPQAAYQEPGEPECGFLFPAFSDRSADPGHIYVYQADPAFPHREWETDILGL